MILQMANAGGSRRPHHVKGVGLGKWAKHNATVPQKYRKAKQTLDVNRSIADTCSLRHGRSFVNSLTTLLPRTEVGVAHHHHPATPAGLELTLLNPSGRGDVGRYRSSLRVPTQTQTVTRLNAGRGITGVGLHIFFLLGFIPFVVFLSFPF